MIAVGDIASDNVADVSSDAVTGVRIADTPEGLLAIHNADCAAAIWQRRPLASFQSWIDALAPAQLPRARVILRPTDVHGVTTQICEICGTPDCRERERLASDIAVMAEIFTALIPTPFLRLRLDVVTTDACRKFHVDTITARLICTYRGAGTQYGTSSGEADPNIVFGVPTGAPIVLRGKLWPERPASGLRHRSPPIEGTGEARLVLVLDPISETDDAIRKAQEETVH